LGGVDGRRRAYRSEHVLRQQVPTTFEAFDPGCVHLREIERVHKDNYGVYGIRKVYAQLAREGGVDGRPVARCTVALCTVARLMRGAGLRGGHPGQDPAHHSPGTGSRTIVWVPETLRRPMTCRFGPGRAPA